MYQGGAGPKTMLVRPRSPHGNGQFWGISGPIVNYKEYLACGDILNLIL